jgi:hypothetical protein
MERWVLGASVIFSRPRHLRSSLVVPKPDRTDYDCCCGDHFGIEGVPDFAVLEMLEAACRADAPELCDFGLPPRACP